MDEFVPQHLPEPGTVYQGALHRDLDASEHRIEESIGPGRTAGFRLERGVGLEDDDDGL